MADYYIDVDIPESACKSLNQYLDTRDDVNEFDYYVAQGKLQEDRDRYRSMSVPIDKSVVPRIHAEQRAREEAERERQRQEAMRRREAERERKFEKELLARYNGRYYKSEREYRFYLIDKAYKAKLMHQSESCEMLKTGGRYSTVVINETNSDAARKKYDAQLTDYYVECPYCVGEGRWDILALLRFRQALKEGFPEETKYIFPAVTIAPSDNVYIHKAGCAFLKNVRASSYGYQKHYDTAIAKMLEERPHLNSKNVYFCPACFPERFRNIDVRDVRGYRCALRGNARSLRRSVTVHQCDCNRVQDTDPYFLIAPKGAAIQNHLAQFRAHGYQVDICSCIKDL